MLTPAMQKGFSMIYNVADMLFSEMIIIPCIVTDVQTCVRPQLLPWPPNAKSCNAMRKRPSNHRCYTNPTRHN